MNAMQLRMARAALNLTVRGAADLSGVSHDTVVRLEKGEALKPGTVAAIQKALEQAGVEFNDDPDNPLVKLRFGSAIEEAVFRNAKSLFPGSGEWRKTRFSEQSADLVGTGPDGGEILVEVKGIRADRRPAIERVADLRSNHPEARIVLILIGGPPMADVIDGVEVYQLPFASGWPKLPAPGSDDGADMPGGAGVRLQAQNG